MKIKNAAATIAIIGAFLFINYFYTYNTKAAAVYDNQIAEETTKTFTAKTNVALTKKWTITFSNEVNENSIQNNIKVLDAATNSPVNVKIELGMDKKTIEILAPGTGYGAGKTYSITINKSVTSTNGKSLAQDVKMNFLTAASSTTMDTAFLKQFSIDLADAGINITNVNERNVVVEMVKAINNYLNNPSQELNVQAAKSAYYGLTSDEQSDLKDVLISNLSWDELIKAYSMFQD